jgi:hypothetical protein
MTELAGRPVPVVIDVEKPAAGLFGGELGPPGERRARSKTSRSADGVQPRSSQATTGETGQTEGSLSRQAEAMFRAEEVKGGPTEK